VLLLVALAACAPQAPQRAAVAVAPLAAEPQRARAALLLPLTGGNAAVGEAALNAAQLALFSGSGPGVELLPIDTGGTPAGAAEATRRAIAAGARIVIGPLTSGETQAAAAPARAARVPLLSFTNDAAASGDGVWALGVTPAQQGRRLAAAAAGDGARRLAITGPEGAFTRQLAAGLREAALEFGLPAPLQFIYPAGTPASAIAREIAERGTAQGGLDAVLLAETGIRVREVAASLAAAGLAAPPLRLMGPALWLQDVALAADPILAGAIFPGPDPSARGAFEQRYQQSFGDRPARIAAIAHDATLIGLRGLRGQGPAELPLGQNIAGADGALRLMPGGEVQRGLAILAVEPGGEPRLVEPAPPPGTPGS
jgi:branched-chain amino acid transport system substrate-binding protein